LIFVVEIGSVRIDLLVVLRFMDELINLCWEKDCCLIGEYVVDFGFDSWLALNDVEFLQTYLFCYFDELMIWDIHFILLIDAYIWLGIGF
jgi:hypothetical protein